MKGDRLHGARPGTKNPVSWPLVLLAVWSVAFGLLIPFFPSGEGKAVDPEGERAVSLMSRAIETLREHRRLNGPPIDETVDPNRTGLIGVEDSPITTSLGHLEAKRTATNPQFAGAVVRMFREAGARRGDPVAVGASGSFPGLILATLCAADALGLRPLMIASLGASNWGANRPDWTWLEMADCLRQKGVLDVIPTAVSIGGDKDVGLDMPEEGRALLELKISASGRPFIRESDLAKNAAARMSLLEQAAGGAPIKAFVNVGGSYPDMGTDGEVLKLKPGYNPAADVFIPPPERRGLIQEMAGRGVPVIHLLFVKGLVDRYGLTWDPFPLPGPESAGADRGLAPGLRTAFLLIYLTGMALGIFWIARKRSRL